MVRKNCFTHRFIYECFYGLITDKRVVDHINNVNTDNRLANLQLVTQRENTIKDYKGGKRLPPIKIRAINTETDESFDYESITKATKDLIVDISGIRYVLNGKQKTTFSKKYKIRFRFKKI